jgi:DNA-directed RNA polymerase specialized sigma24 family protein
LKELRADYKKIIRLKYIEGFRSSQIAKMTKLSVKAVESRLIRARKQFQGLWEYDKKTSKEIVQVDSPNKR